MFGGEFRGQFRADLAGHDLGLLGGDLLGRHALLMFVQCHHLVAMLHGVGDECLDIVEAGVAHCGQLDRRHVEVVLDTVLDPHRHQRVQAEFDQRHLPRQILGLVAHRTADDHTEPIVHGLTGIRRPLAQGRTDAGAGGETVMQNIGIIDRFRLCHNRFRRNRDPGGDRRRQR